MRKFVHRITFRLTVITSLLINLHIIEWIVIGIFFIKRSDFIIRNSSKKHQQTFFDLSFPLFSVYWFPHCFCLFVGSILLLFLSRCNHYLHLFSVNKRYKNMNEFCVVTWQINSKRLNGMYVFLWQVLKIALLAYNLI